MIEVNDSGKELGYINRHKLTIQDLQTIYLDWTNNFLTMEKFAEHYSMTLPQAHATLMAGRKAHEEFVMWCRALEVHRVF